MSASQLDPTFVRAQVQLLRAQYPEIWNEGDDTLIADTLEGETRLHEFLTHVMRRVIEIEALAVGCHALVTNLKNRMQRYELRRDVLRALALKLMQEAGTRGPIEMPFATLSVRAGARKVILTDETQLPDDCVRIERAPNKTMIMALLAQGDAVPGAELSNAEPVLHVRIK